MDPVTRGYLELVAKLALAAPVAWFLIEAVIR